MDRHRRLTIFKGGKFLRPRHRDHGITRDNFFGQATHGFNAQRQRDHIQQQGFIIGLIANQYIGLNRRANSNDLIRINDNLTPAVGEITHLSGRILGPTGEPLRDVQVEIWQVDAKAVYIHTADSDGKDHICITKLVCRFTQHC